MRRSEQALSWWRRGAWEQAGCPATLGDMVALQIEWSNEVLRSSVEAAAESDGPWEELSALWLLGRHRFRLAADCMVSMAERLAAYDTSLMPFWMIRILCDEEPVEQPIDLQEDGVCNVYVTFDVASALKRGEMAFKAAVVDALEQAARLIHDALGANMNPLIDACETIRTVNYRNEWVWGEEVSPEGLCVQVRIVQDVHSMEVFMDVLDEERNTVQSECLIETGPWGNDVWHRYLGDIVWDSPEKVSLVDGHDNAYSLVIDGVRPDF